MCLSCKCGSSVKPNSSTAAAPGWHTAVRGCTLHAAWRCLKLTAAEGAMAACPPPATWPHAGSGAGLARGGAGGGGSNCCCSSSLLPAAGGPGAGGRHAQRNGARMLAAGRRHGPHAPAPRAAAGAAQCAGRAGAVLGADACADCRLHSRRLCTRMSGTCLCADLCGRPPSTRTLTPCCCAMLRAKQTVKDEAILHTTLARVVAPPVATAEGSQAGAASGPAEALQRAVQAMTRDLCGIQAVLDKLWWVKPGRGGAGHGVAGLMLVYLCRPVQRYLRWAAHHLKTPAPLLRLLVAVRAYPCQPGCLGLNRVISRLARGVLTTCPCSPCLSPCTPHPTQPAPAPPPHTPPHTHHPIPPHPTPHLAQVCRGAGPAGAGTGGPVLPPGAAAAVQAATRLGLAHGGPRAGAAGALMLGIWQLGLAGGCNRSRQLAGRSTQHGVGSTCLCAAGSAAPIPRQKPGFVL